MGLNRKVVRGAGWAAMAIIVFMVLCNIWIVASTYDRVLAPDEVAGYGATTLVLGTSYNTTEGDKNPFFYDRVSMATDLFMHHQSKEFILSGSATKYYNEPKAMARLLVEAGVPETSLIEDSLGVRTLSSILRCKRVYNRDKVIIVTQKFHAYRALFISNFYDLDAVVVAAGEESAANTFSVILREIFARPLAVLDLYILHREA